DRGGQLVLPVAQAQGRLEREVGVAGVLADGEVDAADGRPRGPAGVDARVARPAEILEQLWVVRLHRRIDERVVQREGGHAGRHGGPVLVLHLAGEGGVGGRGVGDVADDRGGAYGGRAARGCGGARVEDGAAGAVDVGVEPDGEVLVLGAVDLHV